MNHEYDVLEQLTRIVGPSSYEKAVQNRFSELMKPLCDNVFTDNVGNTYAEIKGERSLPKVMMTAHADTPGFMVSYIDAKGFVFTKDLPGWSIFDYRMLPGSEVRIIGRKSGKSTTGHFIPTVPIHFLTDDDLTRSIDRIDLAIDIGSRSEEQTKRYVSKEDYAVLEPQLSYHCLNGNKTHLVSANLDDRVGLFCLYKIAKNIKRSRMQCKAPIVFASTVSEEGDTGAAGVAGGLIQPQISLTLDGTPATDQIRNETDEVIAKKYGVVALDMGPVIPRGLAADDDLFLFLEKICMGKMGKEGQMPYQTMGQSNEFESAHIYVTGRRGIKTAAVCIPMRNTHTSIETVSLEDVRSTITLCTEFYKKVSKGRFP